MILIFGGPCAGKNPVAIAPGSDKISCSTREVDYNGVMKRTPIEKLLDPRPGSKAAEARDFGIDLTQIAENLRMTPAERIRQNDQAVNAFFKFEAAVRRAKRS